MGVKTMLFTFYTTAEHSAGYEALLAAGAQAREALGSAPLGSPEHAAAVARWSEAKDTPAALSGREESVSASDLAPGAPGALDPAFEAVRAFEEAVAEWDVEYAAFLGFMQTLDPEGVYDWEAAPAVARAVLGESAGPTVKALKGVVRRLRETEARLQIADDRLLSTRPTSELGAAALRAAVRRFVRRPFGCADDEEPMLAKLSA